MAEGVFKGRGYAYDPIARLVRPTTEEIKRLYAEHVREYDERARKLEAQETA